MKVCSQSPTSSSLTSLTDRQENKDLAELNRIYFKVRDVWDNARNNRDECDKDTPKWTQLDQAYEKRSNEVDVVGWLIQICEIGIAISKGQSPNTSEVQEVWEEIKGRWGDVRKSTLKDLDPEYNKLLKIKELGLVDNRPVGTGKSSGFQLPP
jgi:hypothetical protein